MNSYTNKTILSGIQPSGNLHLGNYFGAIKQMIDLQKNNNLFAFIASYHALTTIKDKEILKQYTKNAVLDFLALGIDPDKSTFFIQSDIPEVLELNLILSNITSMGLLERSHSYKDKIANGKTPNHGLFSYPVLMASDILLYDTEVVPVGKDQIQHLEITNEIAKKFNNTFGHTFNLPEASINENLKSVIGIDGKKMSKSYNNTIEIFGTSKQLKKQVGKIITDSTSLEDSKDYTNCNIYALCKLFMTETELKDLEFRYEIGGQGYGHFKKDLMTKINYYFEPYREKREYYSNNPDLVKDIMNEGAKKARKIAQNKIELVRDKVGLSF